MENEQELFQKKRIEQAKLHSMTYAYCQLAKSIADSASIRIEDLEHGFWKYEMDGIANVFADEIYRSMKRVTELRIATGEFEPTEEQADFLRSLMGKQPQDIKDL